MHLDPTIVSIAAFVGVFGMIGAGYFLIRDRSSNSLEDRLDVLSGKKSAKAEAEFRDQGRPAGRGAQWPGRFRAFDRGAVRQSRLLFEQADSSMKAEQFFLYHGGQRALRRGGGDAAEASDSALSGVRFDVLRNAAALSVVHAGSAIQEVRETAARCHGTDRPGTSLRTLTRFGDQCGGRRNARPDRQRVRHSLRGTEPRHPDSIRR